MCLAKRLRIGASWQKRYYDRNVRTESEVREKLRYLHRNAECKPVKAGLCERPDRLEVEQADSITVSAPSL